MRGVSPGLIARPVNKGEPEMKGRLARGALAISAVISLAACASQGRDVGLDSHDLTTLAATVWVDPDGCKHWVIDDGIEGYMSPVLNLDGTPDCI